VVAEHAWLPASPQTIGRSGWPGMARERSTSKILLAQS
jgi:hypothetical protein